MIPLVLENPTSCRALSSVQGVVILSVDRINLTYAAATLRLGATARRVAGLTPYTRQTVDDKTVGHDTRWSITTRD